MSDITSLAAALEIVAPDPAARYNWRKSARGNWCIWADPRTGLHLVIYEYRRGLSARVNTPSGAGWYLRMKPKAVRNLEDAKAAAESWLDLAALSPAADWSNISLPTIAPRKCRAKPRPPLAAISPTRQDQEAAASDLVEPALTPQVREVLRAIDTILGDYELFRAPWGTSSQHITDWELLDATRKSGASEADLQAALKICEREGTLRIEEDGRSIFYCEIRPLD